MSTSQWDDSNCEVEEEYSSCSETKSPNSTYQFNNTLIQNKGDISKAKIFSLKETHSVTPASSKNCGSCADSFEEIFILPKYSSASKPRRSKTKFSECHKKLHLSNQSQKALSKPLKNDWKIVCETKKMISSPKLLSSIRSRRCL